MLDQGHRASAARGAPVYSPAFTGTHCALQHLRQDGHAKLTWLTDYIQYINGLPLTDGYPSQY